MSCAQAVADGFDTILAAGGDGTVYQMVNGVMSAPDAAPPVLGVIPIGGGNDFARSLAIDARPATISRILESKKLQPVDVGLVRYEGKGGTQQRYFINVVDLGMGPHVVRNVTNSRRTFGPGVAYYGAIIKTFYQYRMMNVTAQSAGWQWQGKLRSMALAIGKYYGHGLCVAPDAILDAAS
ncbi:MAG: hypothetical protein HC859_05975 [Bacteroidia bacterium]|nr:hypothetical protein [Bacteroidia bacterium]